MLPAQERFLNRLGLFGIKLGLDNTRTIMSLLGNPQVHPRIVHIAGTNGKGSTLVTLENLLVASGYSVGATISPHLIELNERFRINGRSIDDESLERSFLHVLSALNIDPEKDLQEQKDVLARPTYFELTLAMAFVLFQWNKVDFILLETGMGGRLDATNIIENPIAVVLTKIAKDHERYLGDDLTTITSEKAGIIKEKATVFVAQQSQTVKQQLKEVCDNLSCSTFFFEEEFGYKDLNHSAPTTKSFFLQGKERLTVQALSLRGKHQWDNTATALAIYFFLCSDNRQLSATELNHVLQKIAWPGRLQYLDPEKKILVDGAHNPSAMMTLYTYLHENHSNKKILICIAWMSDKKFLDELEDFSALNIQFQPLETGIEKISSGEEMYQQLQGKKLVVRKPVTLSDFFSRIKETKKEFDLVVVTGSLYLIGAVLSRWKTTSQDTGQRTV